MHDVDRDAECWRCCAEKVLVGEVRNLVVGHVLKRLLLREPV